LRKTAIINGADRVPMQAGELADMADRQEAQYQSTLRRQP